MGRTTAIMTQAEPSGKPSLLATRLKPFMERLFDRYHRREYLSSDPLEFVYLFEAPLDQEAVALYAALLAYGNVVQIRASVTLLLKRIKDSGRSPTEFVQLCGEEPEAALLVLDGFKHRFNTARDWVTLGYLLAHSWKKYGSLGAHFLQGLDDGAQDITDALERLVSAWRKDCVMLADRLPGWPDTSVQFLLTAPSMGSACKRWCMFLRWMGRRDGVDPGLWVLGSPLAHTFPKGRGLIASQLLLPIDTHTGRISRYIGLTARRTLGFKAVLEITSRLKFLDPLDPVKYDFGLARLGILDQCKRKYDAPICQKCDLLPVCQFAESERRRAEAKTRTQKSPARVR